MRLGLGVDVWNQPAVNLPLDLITRAEDLGFDSVWTAEIYGADAVTPLAFLAAHTRRIRLGTAVMQVAARPPVTTAMQIATVDALAGGGRAVCGLGVSGPQIVEGWYGQPWGSPASDLRAYVDIVRQVLRREAPVTSPSARYPLPYRGAGAVGVGKPLKSILHPDPALPVFLATGGPRNVALTAEVADGWLPLGYTPDSAAQYRESLALGNARRDPRLAPLEVWSGSTVVVTDDVAGALARMKPTTAVLVGGYGTREHNFHRDAMVRRGFGEAAERVQELFLAGRREEAAAAIPDEYLDDGALIGPLARIASRLSRWADRTDATGLIIRVGGGAAEPADVLTALVAHPAVERRS
jgi:F420-dependent oxidoreductase-like protein